MSEMYFNELWQTPPIKRVSPLIEIGMGNSIEYREGKRHTTAGPYNKIIRVISKLNHVERLIG